MAKQCRFCKYRDREKLERALIKGEATQEEVANIIGVSQGSISNHLKNHIKKSVKEAIKQEQALAKGLNVTRQLIDINSETRAILKEARDSGDNRLALRAIERAEKQLELQAKLLGDIPGEGTTINIIQSPEYVEFKQLVIGVLDSFPEVKAKFVERLKNAKVN